MGSMQETMTWLHADNQGADQTVHLHSLISALLFPL